MLKKFFITFILTAGLISVPGNFANAANTTIGLVDTQQIIAKSKLYSELRKAEGELAKLQQDFQKDYMDRLNKLQQAKSKSEFSKLQKQYEIELKSKQLEAQKILLKKQNNLEAMRNSLRKKVEAAIQAIAKQKKLTYVVDKQVMYFGGIDITNDVLNRVK